MLRVQIPFPLLNSQLVGEYISVGRVSDCGFESDGFKSHYSPSLKIKNDKKLLFFFSKNTIFDWPNYAVVTS